MHEKQFVKVTFLFQNKYLDCNDINNVKYTLKLYKRVNTVTYLKVGNSLVIG